MGVYVDPSGRSASRTTLVWRGLAMLAMLTVVAVVVTLYTRGAFKDRLTATFVVASVGAGVNEGAEVEYHGLKVGTVTAIGTTSSDSKTMSVALDPQEFTSIPENVGLSFGAASVFGASGVALSDPVVPTGKLTDGDSVRVDPSRTQYGTLPTVLRRMSPLVDTLSSEDVDQLFEFANRYSSVLVDTVEIGVRLARLLAERQQRPVSDLLGIAAEVMPGVADVTAPVLPLIQETVSATKYLDTELPQVLDAVDGLSRFVWRIGDTLRRTYPELSEFIDPVLDVLVPLVSSLSTVGPAYYRIGTLLDRIDGALVPQGSGVRLDLFVVLADAPHILDAIGPAGGQP